MRTQLEAIPPGPESVDKTLRIINDHQADIRRQFLESQRVPASSAALTPAFTYLSQNRTALSVGRGSIGPFQPMPIDGNAFANGAPVPHGIEHFQGQRRDSYQQDSGFFSSSYAATCSDEASGNNTVGPLEPQWPNFPHSTQSMSAPYETSEHERQILSALDPEPQMTDTTESHSQLFEWEWD
jgi:hypothetical protein